jgi:hypothetical protein
LRTIAGKLKDGAPLLAVADHVKSLNPTARTAFWEKFTTMVSGEAANSLQQAYYKGGVEPYGQLLLEALAKARSSQ